MSDLTRMYNELGDTVDPGALTPPDQLRRSADRRARRRTVMAAAAAVLAIAGTAVAVPNLVDANRSGPIVATTPTHSPSPTPATSSPTPSAEPTTTPTGSTSGSTIRPPTSIPDRAFLTQPKDTSVGEPPRSPEDWQGRLPNLCGRTFASDQSEAARRSLVYRYGNPPVRAGDVPNGYLVQTITSYEDQKAAAFMDQLADAVRKCRQETDRGRTIRYGLLTAPDQGDEALLIRVRSDTIDPGTNEVNGTADNLVTVVRIGPVVTILRDIGWESGFETDPEVMQNFTRLAVGNIDRWLG